MDYLGTLNALAPKFGLLPEGSKLEWTLRINAPPEAGGSGDLALAETVRHITQAKVPVDIDLTLVGKWVRSGNSDLPTDPATEDPIGGMPIVEQVVVSNTLSGLLETLPPPALMSSDEEKEAVPGVPEVLGRIKGTVTQTVEKVTEVVESRPLTLAVRWRVLDESTPGVSSPASDVRYRTAPDRPWQGLPDALELPEGGKPAPGTPKSLSLQFPALLSELKSGTPDVRTFKVQTSIKLSLTPPNQSAVTTSWIDLPSVPIVIPTIPVPTILVLCEHREFAGRKVVLVPSNSLLAEATAPGGIGIGDALNLTNSALESLASSNYLIGFLASPPGTGAATAANVLKSLAASPGQTIIAAHSRVDDLSAQEFVFAEGTFGFGRFTGDNMASSIICIGRPGTVFDFFQDPNLNEAITRMQVTLDGRLGCAIKKLDRINPARDAVYGGGITSHRPKHHYEDCITSLAYSGPSDRYLSLDLAIPTGPMAAGDDMQPGEVLVPEGSITSPNGEYRFVYQADGNLVLYRVSDGKPLWASDTVGALMGVCIMQDDGNLVIYGPGPRAVWDTGSSSNEGSSLYVQNDGNVVIYRPDETLVWATNTAQP